MGLAKIAQCSRSTLFWQCIRNYGKNSCKVPVEKRITCAPVKRLKPDYFKKPNPCKSDAELRARPRLGFPRCKIPYLPKEECMDLCFNIPRLDDDHYRPSRSLHRKYQVHWVECFREKRAKCCTGGKIMPELNIRKPRKPRCPAALKCKTMKPLNCELFKPKAPSDHRRCIKYPICECKGAVRVCKAEAKPGCKCKRILTRYPSFSECRNEPLNKVPITECWVRPSICEMWRTYRRLHGKMFPGEVIPLK